MSLSLWSKDNVILSVRICSMVASSKLIQNKIDKVNKKGDLSKLRKLLLRYRKIY